MEFIKESRNVPVKDNYDVIVVGGGVAGIAAAVCASRLGSKTLLIEKSAMLGGLATLGLIAWYEPLCDGEGHQMIYGISEELLKLSIKYGYGDIPEQWETKAPIASPNSPRYATYFSPNIFAMALDRYVEENNVTLRLDMIASYPVMYKNHCCGIITESKSGREYFPAKVVIDASGDADIIHRANIPCTVNKHNFLSMEVMRSDLNSYQKAIDEKDILKGRSWLNLGANLFGTNHPKDMRFFSGVTNEDVTEYLLETRKLVFEKIKDEDRKSRDIITLPGMAQFRKTRRINGDYLFTENDAFKHFEDSIGAIGDFSYRGQRYEIPYRCLYNSNFDNLLAAGRIISSDGYGWEVTRVIPVAALTGEAAGAAAHISIKKDLSIANIPIKDLQTQLKNQKIMLHIPEELAKASRTEKKIDWH